MCREAPRSPWGRQRRLSSPAHLRDWRACSKAKRGRPKPVPGPVGAQRQGTDRVGGAALPPRPRVGAGTAPSAGRCLRGRYKGSGNGRGRPGPNRGRTGAGRASRAGLVTWSARPNQYSPRARGRAHAQCRPAALPECHVRGQGPRETAAPTNRERRQGERGQWEPVGGERGRRPTRGGGRGVRPDRQPMEGTQWPGQRCRPMAGGRSDQ